MKPTMSEKKNTLDGIKNTLYMTDKKISELEDTEIELPKMKQKKR